MWHDILVFGVTVRGILNPSRARSPRHNVRVRPPVGSPPTQSHQPVAGSNPQRLSCDVAPLPHSLSPVGRRRLPSLTLCGRAAQLQAGGQARRCGWVSGDDGLGLGGGCDTGE